MTHSSVTALVAYTLGASPVVAARDLAPGWAVVRIAFWSPDNFLGSILQPLEPPTFPAEWFRGLNLLAKILIIDWFLLITAASGWKLLRHWSVVLRSHQIRYRDYLRRRIGRKFFYPGFHSRLGRGIVCHHSTHRWIAIGYSRSRPVGDFNPCKICRPNLPGCVRKRGDRRTRWQYELLYRVAHTSRTHAFSERHKRLDISTRHSSGSVLSQGIPYLAFLATTLLPNLLNHYPKATVASVRGESAAITSSFSITMFM
jgi:hypothetical protein